MVDEESTKEHDSKEEPIPRSDALAESTDPVDETERTAAKDRLQSKVATLGIIANVFYLFGAGNFVAFSVLEYNGRDRGAPANVTYSLTFVFFLLNGVVELCIDLFLDRRSAHGRYFIKFSWNVAISIVFIVGTILDVVAFSLWNRRNFVRENRVLYASSHAWLLSAILTLVGQMRQKVATNSERFDAAGNLLFLVGALVDCFARYFDDADSPSAEDKVVRKELSSSVLYLVNAIFYLLADMLRLRLRSAKNRTAS